MILKEGAIVYIGQRIIKDPDENGDVKILVDLVVSNAPLSKSRPKDYQMTQRILDSASGIDARRADMLVELITASFKCGMGFDGETPVEVDESICRKVNIIINRSEILKKEEFQEEGEDEENHRKNVTKANFPAEYRDNEDIVRVAYFHRFHKNEDDDDQMRIDVSRNIKYRSGVIEDKEIKQSPWMPLEATDYIKQSIKAIMGGDIDSEDYLMKQYDDLFKSAILKFSAPNTYSSATVGTNTRVH